MLLAGGGIGAEGGDQVGVGGDVLQAVDLGRRGRVVDPAFVKAVGDEVPGRRVDVGAEGALQVAIVPQILGLAEQVGLAALGLAVAEKVLLAGGALAPKAAIRSP